MYFGDPDHLIICLVQCNILLGKSPRFNPKQLVLEVKERGNKRGIRTISILRPLQDAQLSEAYTTVQCALHSFVNCKLYLVLQVQ